MTKQGFALIADVLRLSDLDRAQRATLAASFAAALSRSEPSFKREGFLLASIPERRDITE